MSLSLLPRITFFVANYTLVSRGSTAPSRMIPGHRPKGRAQREG
jgi:hypothetical protein